MVRMKPYRQKNRGKRRGCQCVRRVKKEEIGKIKKI
ncbi:hypothetical protein BACCAP_02231 [Pseudoflavonifractor capillosus ATCC 29799]|uniref:Uncharacterized protein n=1 Tax=Pseudoflavonifractor capillosus ATCC 29799 TaxID=411467 RepID=A6NVI9_9FIRM|nr:hypothetical protein BACCAP_02231 [Pseudoflavonifractor capillosus ATCC 29799]